MTARYLPFHTLDEYLDVIATRHPRLYAALDLDRPGTADTLAELAATSSEFDSDRDGRGDSYRRAQQDSLVRWTGIRALLRLAAPVSPAAAPLASSAFSDTRAGAPLVLDVLGGDGTLARAVRSRADSFDAEPIIITGDLSGRMIDAALAHGLPAVRQAAQFLFLRDSSMHAVLLAYGTHHIPPEHRPTTVAEAVRVTRPGGRIVVHDFDESSPMAAFFADVVHPNAAGGHAYTHFSRAELTALFRDAGLPVRTLDLPDPLIVHADTEQAAKARMCRYVADMYGIGDHFASLGDTAAAWRTLERHFDHSSYRSAAPAVPPRPVVYQLDGRFVAEIPRMAIVAVAQKPSRSSGSAFAGAPIHWRV